MHFTLQQLKFFEAVLRNSSYTKAAQELHITQPAVSIQIKRLEEQAGIELFEKIGKKIFPTSAGQIMYGASRDILNRVAELKDSMEALKGEVTGALNLSVVTTTKYFMPHLIGRFLENYPTVEPKLIFSNRSKIIERLSNNEDDFVVMGQTPGEDRFEIVSFLENILVIVAHPSHPLANKKNIPLKALVEERFLEREIGSGTREAFANRTQEKGFHIEPYMELGSNEAIKQGVMAGLGISLLSEHSIQLEKNAKKLVVLDIQGFPIVRPWYAVHLKGKKLSLVAKTFLDYIRKEQRTVQEIIEK